MSVPPDNIEPNLCPDGLVCILHGNDNEVIAMALLGSDVDVESVATEHADACSENPGYRVVIYDGDSGQPMIALKVADLA